MFTFVIGGSASGKSDYAERHVLSLGGGGPRIYIATMEQFGEEAQARIARHHAMRRGRGFETIECRRNVGSLVLLENSNVLLEDLGNLVANEMFGAAGMSEDAGTPSPEDAGTPLSERIAGEIKKLRAGCAHLTIVANEVFSGGKEYEGETLAYLRVLAELSRRLAQRADQVVEVVCGQPVRSVWKENVCGQPEAGSSGQPAPAPSGQSAVSREKGQTGADIRSRQMRERAKGSRMIFVTGPLFAGKQEYIMKALGWDEAAFERDAVRDVQELAAQTPGDQLEALADSLASKRVVIATEVGGGVVPLDPDERRSREAAGRLACLLAARADTVIRVHCGLPCLLKGEQLP